MDYFLKLGGRGLREGHRQLNVTQGRMQITYREAIPAEVSFSYLTQSVFKVVLQKSIPTQIRQLILSVSNSEG
jgi:hypothetical protein